MKDLNRIIVIGDSLALPRNEISYYETWIYKLKKCFFNFDIIDKSKRASTIDILNSAGDYNGASGADFLEFYKPKFVIIQIGICDCSPRLFNRRSIEFRIISRFPKNIRESYINLVKKTRKRSEKRAYTKIDEYGKNIEKYIQRSIKIGVKKIFFIKILNTGKKFKSKNSKVQKSIEKYNDILEKLKVKYLILKLIEPFKYKNIDNFTLEDGYHLNSKGHDVIFKNLRDEIKIND